MRRHCVRATLVELRSLRIHCLRASWRGGAPEDIIIRGISLHGGGRSIAIGPVVPVTLTSQVCHGSKFCDCLNVREQALVFWMVQNESR